MNQKEEIIVKLWPSLAGMASHKWHLCWAKFQKALGEEGNVFRWGRVGMGVMETWRGAGWWDWSRCVLTGQEANGA